MARFHDKVGFLIPVDNQETGISEPQPVERRYYGKIIEHTRKWETADHLLDNLNVTNQISITANDYAFKHASAIAYVRYMNGWWKVVSIRVKAPEIILTLGGVWNGPTVSSAEAAGTGSESLVPEATGE